MFEAVLSALWMLALVLIVCTMVAAVAGARYAWYAVDRAHEARREREATIARQEAEEEEYRQQRAARAEEQRRKMNTPGPATIPAALLRDSRPNPLHEAIQKALDEQQEETDA